MSGSSQDVSILLVPSLRQIIESLDRQSLQQLQSALCGSPAKQGSILWPLVDSPTLIQVQ